MKKAVQWMLNMSGVKPDLLTVPAGVEVQRRVGSGRQVFMIENFSNGKQAINLPRTMSDVFSGKRISSITLPIYGVSVLQERTENEH